MKTLVLVLLAGFASRTAALELPPAGATLIGLRPAGRSLADFEFSLSIDDETAKRRATVKLAQFEIRYPDHRFVRVDWPYAFHLPAPLTEGRAILDSASRSTFSEQQLGEMGHTPPGIYQVAFLINGARASNVATFRIDQDFDDEAGHMFRLSALEPSPLGRLSRVLLHVRGPEPIDPKLTNMAIVQAPILIDGMERKRTMILWSGPVGPLNKRSPFCYVIDTARYMPSVDPATPHEYGFRFEGYPAAAPLKLEPLGHPLADSWIRDASLFREMKAAPVLLSGHVTDSAGKPAVGAQVSLHGDRDLSARADESGAYAFRGVPPGDYSISCVPDPSQGQPMFTRDKANLTPGMTIDFDFRCPLRVGGNVRNKQGNPAAGITVHSTWQDEKTATEYTMFAVTDEHGRYEISGPYEKISFLDVQGNLDAEALRNVKPGRKDANFVVGSK